MQQLKRVGTNFLPSYYYLQKFVFNVQLIDFSTYKKLLKNYSLCWVGMTHTIMLVEIIFSFNGFHLAARILGIS